MGQEALKVKASPEGSSVTVTMPWRIIREGKDAVLAIMDATFPIYEDPESGEQMADLNRGTFEISGGVPNDVDIAREKEMASRQAHTILSSLEASVPQARERGDTIEIDEGVAEVKRLGVDEILKSAAEAVLKSGYTPTQIGPAFAAAAIQKLYECSSPSKDRRPRKSVERDGEGRGCAEQPEAAEEEREGDRGGPGHS